MSISTEGIEEYEEPPGGTQRKLQIQEPRAELKLRELTSILKIV